MHKSADFVAFVAFTFHGPTLGHVSGLVGTCKVVDHKMNCIVLYNPCIVLHNSCIVL